jgi:hypothetical protein
MPEVPRDGRVQGSTLDIMMANDRLGRPPFAGASKIGRDTWVINDSWPRVPLGRPSRAVPEAEPEAPKSAAQTIWPDLP